jgi:hypothetical protein
MTPDTDIQALAFFPADHAVVVQGKLYVNGGCWDRLQFPTYPQVLPISVVAVLVVPPRAYLQDHTFEIDLEDADGKPAGVHVEGQFRVGADPNMRVGDPSTLPIAVPVNTVTVERPGHYAFVLRVDGTEISRYRLRAVQLVHAFPESRPPSADPTEESSEE